MNGDLQAQLQRHQEVLYELLQTFDAVCRKHQISYMLFAGTALGAVRHQGFIPWDDDLDVVMLRQEYERFLAVAEQELDGEKYYLQKEFSRHWPMFFSKLRKNNTACMERYVPRDQKIHQGVYIDIFPCDNMANDPVMRLIQYLASKVVVTKALDRRGYLTDSWAKKIAMVLCRVLPAPFFLTVAKREWDGQGGMVHTFFGGSSQYGRSVFPRQWFTETVLLPFAGGQFPVSAYYHELLTVLYDDYMTPLPEEKRLCKIHAELVDMERCYTDYLAWQRHVCFREYSRSIR